MSATYADADALKDLLRETITAFPDAHALALAAATGQIDRWCGRSFFPPADDATEKILRADQCDVIWVPDVATVDDLVVSTDDVGDGTFSVTWDADQWQAEPFDRAGATTPIELLRAVGSRRFPLDCRRRARVSITAKWGWPATPNEVVQSCLLLSADLIRAADAGSRVLTPGVGQGQASFGGFFSGGLAAVALTNPIVEALLAPLRKIVVA